MTALRGHSTVRQLRATALCVLLAACSGAEVTPPAATGLPGSNGSSSLPAESGPPGDSFAPLETPEPIDTGPLPEPTLGSIDEIVAAIGDPDRADQVVVSILVQLGLGLYRADGTPIRKGSETSDADFYVFEPVAQGLVTMLRQRNDPHEQTSFRDYHAGLVTGGYGGSAEGLATAFTDAYAAQPDAPISRFVAALGPIEVDGKLSDFELWVMSLDGFIRPNRSATAMAVAASGVPLVAAGGGGWGVARSNIQARGTVPPSEWVAIANQLAAICSSWRVTIGASPASVPEGHGGTGSPTRLTARIAGRSPALTSPFGGGTIIPAASGAAGIDVEWVAGDTAARHGTLDATVTSLEASGQSETTFTPKQEQANGQGIDREESGLVYAGVWRRDLLVALYGSFARPYVAYMDGHRYGQGVIIFDWHEKAEAVIKIIWTDFYNGVEDRITFLGDLTSVEGDPASGGLYTGSGTATGSRAGWAGCNPGIDVVPSGTVPATFNGILTGSGTIMISAYADAFSPLGGISTAPIEVPLEGGTGIFTSSEVGELCPHSSDGELTLTNLTLPTP